MIEHSDRSDMDVGVDFDVDIGECRDALKTNTQEKGRTTTSTLAPASTSQLVGESTVLLTH